MAPKKKAKPNPASTASTPHADSQPKTPVDTTTPAGEKASEDIVNDPWSVDQETLLLKSLIRWKPTGMHKHFRMLSISNDLRSHGYTTQSAAHTRIPGIWAKLSQLYDLATLDERENLHQFMNQPDPHDDDPAEWYKLPDFELPEDEFGDLIWRRRFQLSDAEKSSEPDLPDLLDAARSNPAPLSSLGKESVDEEADKDETEIQSSPPAKGRGRNTRTSGRGGRGGKAAGRVSSKAQSAVSESAEDEEDDEDEEEEEESEDQTQQPKGSRRKSGRGRRTRKR